jgi:hypothetical protein
MCEFFDSCRNYHIVLFLMATALLTAIWLMRKVDKDD